jgi:S-phase kinase-associated protein 1
VLCYDLHRWRFAYHAWCAVLQQDCQEADHVCTDESHSGLVRVALAQFLNTLHTDSSPSSAATADFLQKSTDIVQLVCDLQRRATLDEIPSAVDTFDGCVARLTWIAAEAEKLGGPDPRELLIARTRVPLLKQAAYEACTSKSFGGEGSAQLLQLFTQVIDRTTALAVSVAQSESLSTGDLAEQVAVTAEQRQRFNHAWVRCVSAHHLQQAIFRCQQGKPEQLAAVCARSMESAHTAWAVWKERGWRPPSDPLAPAAHGLSNDVALVSSDGERFVVGLEVARQFEEVMSIIDACARAPLSSRGGHTEEICVAAESPILSKVIEFATYQAHCAGVDSDEVNERNARLIDVDQGTLFHLILASNNMGIKLLLDLTCKAVADMIKGKTPEEIRAHFNIQNDFTPEEEEEVRRENAWCEDI